MKQASLSSSTDQGGGKRRSGMGNHFSNRHSPNSNSMVSTAIPATKTTGPNQSIFVASQRQARRQLTTLPAIHDGVLICLKISTFEEIIVESAFANQWG